MMQPIPMARRGPMPGREPRKLQDQPMTTITGYHAHVYYDAATREHARQLCEAAGRRFPINCWKNRCRHN